MFNPPPYTFENYCKINNLNYKDYDKPPYSFKEYLDKYPNLIYGDFNPYIVYDGYVYSLECEGYTIYGNSTYGIGVK